MSFTVASYNVLATAYVPHTRYRRTPQDGFRPGLAYPRFGATRYRLRGRCALFARSRLATFAALKSRLSSLGYAAEYARKTGGKPDGCATFYRQRSFEVIAARVVEYADGGQGQANSGHIALIL